MDEQKRNRKLQLKEILEDVDINDLKSFIYQYARKDSPFEVALKAHFVSRVSKIDGDLKYHRILGEIIKPKTFAHPKIGPTARKTISIVLTDFKLQMSDLLSTEDYKEAYYIIKSSLDKIAYLQNKYALKDKSVEECRTSMLDGLAIILKQNLAPKFRLEVEKNLLDIVSTSYYIPKEKNVITLLNDLDILTEKDKINIINDLNAKREQVDDQTNISMTVIQLTYPFVPLAKDVLVEMKQELVYEGLSSLIKKRKFRYVDFFLTNKHIEFNFNREILQCHYHLNKENYEELSQYLIKLDTKHIPVMVLKELIHSLHTTYLKSGFKVIKSWVDTLPFGFKARIYDEAEAYEELIGILKEHNDFEWLKVYDSKLIKLGFKQDVQDLYMSVSNNYFESHMGTKANEFVRKLEQRLKTINQDLMIIEIKEKLFENFSHRTTFNIF